MHRYVLVLVTGLLLGSAAYGQTTDSTPTPTVCPADLRAAVAQSCPCDGSRNHGKYVKCVRTALEQLKKDGCDTMKLRKAAKCAASSLCGKQKKNLVVCCSKYGRAKLATAARCTAHGGTVKSGATSLCDVNCKAAAASN